MEVFKKALIILVLENLMYITLISILKYNLLKNLLKEAA